jgi:hypothetical protein
MKKNSKTDPKHILKHKIDSKELLKRDWKHQDPKKTISDELSNKAKQSHYTQKHRWAIPSEKKKGPKI